MKYFVGSKLYMLQSLISVEAVIWSEEGLHIGKEGVPMSLGPRSASDVFARSEILKDE